MIDPVVERQFSDCRELLGLWKTFHDFFVMGVKGENITPDKEAQFLDIKSRIAMLHDSFMEALTHDQNIGQEVMGLVARSITLKHLNRQSTADIKKMEIEWHESYLLLNETIGSLEDKRKELSEVNEAQYRASKAGAAARQRVTTFFTSGYFKIAVIIAAVLFFTIGVQVLGIFDWNSLASNSVTRTPYRMGVAVYRKLIDPEHPWPNIDAWNRLPFTSWPSGVKEPQIRNDSKEAAIAKMPAQDVKEMLNGALEYRKEETSRSNEGTVEIHTFRFADTTSAKAVEEEWNKFIETELGKKSDGTWKLWRNVNIVTILTGTNQAFVNGMLELVLKKS